MTDDIALAPDRARVQLVYYFCRVQLPSVQLAPRVYEQHLQRTFQLHARKSGGTASWEQYLDNLYPLDWFLAAACLESDARGWEYLATARAGRSDTTLADALR